MQEAREQMQTTDDGIEKLLELEVSFISVCSSLKIPKVSGILNSIVMICRAFIKCCPKHLHLSVACNSQKSV
jgi:hypothetical protein